MTKCKNPSCAKEVTSIEGRRPKEFCSVECRTKFHNGKKAKGTGRGRPKGVKNKVKVINIEGFQMDIKTVPTYDIKPQSEWGSEMNAVSNGIKYGDELKVGVSFTDVNGVQDAVFIEPKPKCDFSNVVFLQIEDFTEYPKSNCPAGGFERTEYLAKKKESDDKIRAAFNSYKSTK